MARHCFRRQVRWQRSTYRCRDTPAHRAVTLASDTENFADEGGSSVHCLAGLSRASVTAAAS